ncbi:hypothetical protein BH09PSE5_BH09PSE5_36450 [soil metagenome]
MATNMLYGMASGFSLQPLDLSTFTPSQAQIQRELARRPVRAEHPPQGAPITSNAAALRWIDGKLSTPVAADSPFPNEVLPGWKLNFANLQRTVAQLTGLMEASLPNERANRSIAATHRAVQQIPEHLAQAVERWYRQHSDNAVRWIAPDQFNLLVADEFRAASKVAAKLADSKSATPGEREAARELAAMLKCLKRIHYASNVQHLYKASGKRALPEIEALVTSGRPGFSSDTDVGVSVTGGVGIEVPHVANIELAASLRQGHRTLIHINPEGEYQLSAVSKPAIGIGANAEFGLGPKMLLGKADIGIDATADLGRQIKSRDPETIYAVHGERGKYATSFWNSAGPTRRGFTESLANVGNAIGDFLIDNNRLFDPYKPTHANTARHMRGMYIETTLHSHAAALDRLAASHGHASGGEPGPGPGPIESLMAAAYPSLRSRIAAMDAPDSWTAEQVHAQLPGQNDIRYPGMPRNALGRPEPMRWALRTFAVKPSASAGIGPTEKFANSKQEGAEAQGAEASESAAASESKQVKLAVPTLRLTADLPAIYDSATNKLARLTPVVDLMNVGMAGDFAPVLTQLRDVRQRYDEGCSGGGHPHLKLMDSYNAMKQMTLALPSRMSDAAWQRRATEDTLIYGDRRDMPDEFRVAIGAMRNGALSATDMLRSVDANLRTFAYEDARFKADAADCWARRHTAAGSEALRRLSRQCLGSDESIPRRPKEADFTAFFGLSYDRYALTLCNLGAQRSVALHEGVRQLSTASDARKAEFQRLADAGAVVYKARVAAHNEHNLPLTKEQAWRNSSIASVGGSDRSEVDAVAGLEFDPGILAAATLLTKLPSLDTSIGTTSGRIGFTSTRQKASTNPLLVGRTLNVRAEIQGGFPFPQIAVPILNAALVDKRTRVPARGIPRGLIEEIASAPLKVPFGQKRGTLEVQWRLAPHEPAPERHGDGHPDRARVKKQGDGASRHTPPESVRVLQFWRASTESTMKVGVKSPNLLAAASPGVLKLGADLSATTVRPRWQENGPCPAYNVLDWNRYLRPLMWDAATDRPLPFEQIAANFEAAPYELTKHFSRFNPSLFVNELFRQAVVDPDGPRNEFHRMLYSAEGARQRAFGEAANRARPDSDAALFDRPPVVGMFDAMVTEARTWQPVDVALADRLAAMPARVRAHYFTTDPAGQQQLQRYMSLMEVANKYNLQGKDSGRGYRLATNNGLIAARKVSPAKSFASSRASNLGARIGEQLRGAAQSLRLTPEQPKLPATAEMRSRIGVAPDWRGVNRGGARETPETTRF